MTLPAPIPCPYCEHPVRPGRKCWGCEREDPLGEVNRAGADTTHPNGEQVGAEGPRTASVPVASPESWSATLTWALLASDNLRAKGKGYSHHPDYVAARDGAALYLRDQYDHAPIEGPVRVSVDFYPPDRRVRDCTNYLKALHDALELAGVIGDDRQIRAWEGCVHEPEAPGRADLTVTKIFGVERAA